MSRCADKARLPLHVLRAIKSALKRQDWFAAMAEAEAAVAARPECADAHHVFALAAIYCDDLAAALQAAMRATELAPGVGDHEDLLAVIYGLAGDLNNALFHGKVAAGAPRTKNLAGLAPETFPSLAQVFLQIEERPLLKRGLAAQAKGRNGAAEAWLRQHLVFEPESREAVIGLGASLLAQNAPAAAVEALRAARHRLPDDAAIASLLGQALTRAGDFELARACHASARLMAPEDCEVAAIALLDALGDPRNFESDITAAYADWCRTHVVGDNDAPRLRLQHDPDRPLRIGYLIGDAAGLPMASWLADILSYRDMSRFTTVGFGAGPLSAPANHIFQKCVDGWQDVADADALTLAAMVRAEDIDILVDLAGLSAPALHKAFGARMAPCQVAWLGLAALSAPAAVDFILTDRFVNFGDAGVAPSMAGRLVNLDIGSTLATPPDDPAAPDDQAPSADEVLLVADAGLSDLNAVTAERWAAILHAVPHAKLVLRDAGLTQPDALKRVLDIFGSFGVAHRIDVIDETAPRTFFAHGHVALLPMPCPRPESLSDALSAGIPVVCPVGPHAAGRAAASILEHLNIAAETVAVDRDGYVARAVRWAVDDAARAAFPAQLVAAGSRSGVWDPAARARDLEAAFGRMWATASAMDAPTLTAISA